MCYLFPGEAGEVEPVEGSHRVQGPDSDLMDGETEGDTVVIAGQPEVLSTQAMQVTDWIVLTPVTHRSNDIKPHILAQLTFSGDSVLSGCLCILFICLCEGGE